jgi:glycosyltransferase involved in cell wall biosynthesis
MSAPTGSPITAAERPHAPPEPIALHRGRPLRVLHGAYQIAGQGNLLAQSLREWGVEARALSYRVAWDERGGDLVVDLDRLRGNLAKGVAMARTFLRWGRHYDLYHFHFGTSFLPRLLDLPLLAGLGKPIVFHFHGCDIRSRRHMLERHRLSTCTDCDPFCRPARQQWLHQQAARYAGRVLFSTMDLAESVPSGEHFPLALDVARWEEAARTRPLEDFSRRDGIRGPVVIGHAPTNRLIKGTRHVVAAVERLKRELPRVELRLLEGQPWAEVPGFIAGCDILVDQLMMGWYGLLAIEGMAESKAVVLHLREDFRGIHPELPIAEADPDTLYQALRDLARDPPRRAALGERGVEFVRRHHDLRPVGRRLLEIYRKLLD